MNVDLVDRKLRHKPILDILRGLVSPARGKPEFSAKLVDFILDNFQIVTVSEQNIYGDYIERRTYDLQKVTLKLDDIDKDPELSESYNIKLEKDDPTLDLADSRTPTTGLQRLLLHKA